MKVRCINRKQFIAIEKCRDGTYVTAEPGLDDVCDDLTIGKVYDVIAVEDGWYRIIDDLEDEDYIYPAEYFEIVEG